MSNQPQTALADGGPAFPADSFAAQHCPGMSLRDWFAGQALASFVPDTPQNKAEAAYAIADAMLKARMLEHEANGGSHG